MDVWNTKHAPVFRRHKKKKQAKSDTSAVFPKKQKQKRGGLSASTAEEPKKKGDGKTQQFWRRRRTHTYKRTTTTTTKKKWICTSTVSFFPLRSLLTYCPISHNSSADISWNKKQCTDLPSRRDFAALQELCESLSAAVRRSTAGGSRFLAQRNKPSRQLGK